MGRNNKKIDNEYNLFKNFAPSPLISVRFLKNFGIG